MVLDYSKFDHIELSDDSDIEVHPNIDKKSFIKWKQRDIHEKRERAKTQMEHYRVEVDMNKELMKRIEDLMLALKTRIADPPSTVIATVMQGYPPQVRPETSTGPTFNEMMESLLRQVSDDTKSIREEDKAAAISHKLSMHRDKLLNIIVSREKDIKNLEAENSKKITSEGLREGFNFSSVKKIEPEAPIKESILKTHPSKEKKITTIETLNPESSKPTETHTQMTEQGYESDGEMSGEGLPEHIEPSKLGREFGSIEIGHYDECLRFIGKHSNIIRDETETDGLLIDAYYAQIKGESKKARQFIHQGLLLQFCRQLGRDGVSMFFHRIKDKSHKATQVFNQELESTYSRIKLRAEEARAEDEAAANAASDSNEPVEQIQLHAVDPGTKIAINVPAANSSDAEGVEARAIFESFSPALQKALEKGKLEAINKVLGNMKVEEAEVVVDLLSRGGMLAIEEEILDATQPDFQMPERARLNKPIDEGYVEEEAGETLPEPTAVQMSAVDDVD